MAKRRTVHGLGELQAEVMEIVWDKGQATVADVVEAISRRRPVTYTTVLVAMQKLRRKGWLKHKSEGRAYVYSPRRTREQVHGGLLKEFLRSAFGGDARLLLSQLLDAQPMSAPELDELRRLIEQRKKELGRESTY
ncbi:MAG TPA: BlaI/MecI/CopY family transcriptional regulator [Pirellulales bacterium]|nr:BlaI/MecI/CopY family transcriptional regulator [Pirellulales bacterium]